MINHVITTRPPYPAGRYPIHLRFPSGPIQENKNGAKE